MVFYRKYRPQTIDELDNEAVRKTLSSVLKNSSTHAFLFTGPKGLGKTSTARIIAKVVNCTDKKKDEIEPCNKCDQCISITSGTNLDVLEIDAASNRGIDEIRDLREKIRLTPVGAKTKVYIIDEVHMLTTEAFNALLKTLEEPPVHAMFVLCTTEPHKVPATIMSRCMHINFTPATEEELVRSFKRIVKSEKIIADDKALQHIASMSDRGFRDGVKILEEVVALADGKKITLELVEEKYKISNSQNYVTKMLDVFSKRNQKGGLEIVGKLVEQGLDIKHFIILLMEKLHSLLLVKAGLKTDDNIDSGLTIEELRVLFALLSKANMEMKTSVLAQLPLELAIIEFCELQNVIPSEVDLPASARLWQAGESHTKDKLSGTRSLHSVDASVGMTKKAEEGVTVSSLRKQVGTIKKIQALYGESDKKETTETEIVKTSTVELMHSSPNGEITEEWLDHFWKNIISEIKSYNHTIAGVLRGCSIKNYDKSVLVIQTGYKFHKERLSEAKTLDALEKVCKLLTGKVIEVKVELA